MADQYIQSNDDSGNLALYGGLLAGGLVVGSALAYRASSPHYKKGGKGSSSGLLIPEKGVGYGKGSTQFALGGMAKVLTGGRLGGATFDEGVKNMTESVVRDHFNQNSDHYKKNLSAIKDTMDAGMGTLGGDAAAAKEMIGKGQNDKAVINQILQQNPNSMLNEDDLANIRRKQELGHGQGLSQQELEGQYASRYEELKKEAARRKERNTIEQADADAYQSRLQREAQVEAAHRNARPQNFADSGGVLNYNNNSTLSRIAKDRQELLAANPNMSLQELGSQLNVPSHLETKVLGDTMVAQQRAQARASTPTTPSLQERLDAYKFQKQYGAAQTAHMDSMHAEANRMNNMYDVQRRTGQLNQSEIANWSNRANQVANTTPVKPKQARGNDEAARSRQSAYNQEARRQRYGRSKPVSRFKGSKILSAIL